SGLKTERWQAAAYINNIADKTAELALDYERGRSARVGYLTNQPRTIGVYGSYNFGGRRARPPAGAAAVTGAGCRKEAGPFPSRGAPPAHAGRAGAAHALVSRT